jgi:uncharacterized protein
MKIQIERGASYCVHAYDAAGVTVARGEQLHTFTAPLVLQADTAPVAWTVAAATPPLAAFEALLEHRPELVIYGSGARLRFPGGAVMQLFHRHGIGFETMDTFAACRTFNVLSHEGRRVLAALLVGPLGAG